jgi:hypothetical protein
MLFANVTTGRTVAAIRHRVCGGSSLTRKQTMEEPVTPQA